jgi:hypothetical protein
MGSGAQAYTIAKRSGPFLLGGALCAAVFVMGVSSRSAAIPAMLHSGDVSLSMHPFWFCLLEAFWLVAAAVTGIRGLRVFGSEWSGFTAAGGTPIKITSGTFPLPVGLASRPGAPVAVAVKRAASRETDNRELRLVSPNGRYVIYVHPEKMHGGALAFKPEMFDSTTKRVIFHPRQRGWTLESAVWQTASLLSMSLRRYPGDPAPIAATFDCASRTAHIDGIPVEPFHDAEKMEQALEEAYESSRVAQ